MKSIEVSGWYHVSGDKIYHYFRHETNKSLCGKLENYNNRLKRSSHTDETITDHSCNECEILKVDLYMEKSIKVFGEQKTYYIPSVCPDCKSDCVIISSTPEPIKELHIHLGCPAND